MSNVVLVLAAGAIVAALALGIFMVRTRLQVRAFVQGNAELRQRFGVSRARFDLLFASCNGLPNRLHDLADAAEAHARVLRLLSEADLDLRLTPAQLGSDWNPPWDLRRDTPRLPVTAWQRLDRALEQLAAVIDAPDGDPTLHADVYDEIAAAARAVGEQLAATHDKKVEYSSATAVCGFCGTSATKVRKVIAGPHVLICDECVALCVEILDDEFGDDWRTRPAHP
jgi:hypothetical protein